MSIRSAFKQGYYNIERVCTFHRMRVYITSLGIPVVYILFQGSVKVVVQCLYIGLRHTVWTLIL